MDLLTRQREEVSVRLSDLREQAAVLEFADAALAGVDLDAIGQARATLGLDHGPAPSDGSPAAPGQRRAQVLAVVRAHPEGMEASAVAAKCGIAATHAYGPLRALERAGDVKKTGRLWLPARQGE